jgi:P4 family phage/plasmid primase-like protien
MESLTLQPTKNVLNGITLKEKCDVSALRKLIHSSLLKPTLSKWKQHNYTSEKQQLTKYLSLIGGNTATVQYNKVDKQCWGRSNPNDMVSLFTLRKEIRHTISGMYYTDIDIENCHPTILYQVCKKFNIECTLLESYVLNRKHYLDTIVSHYTVSLDSAKLLFIIILYGGGYNKWCSEVDINKPALDFINDFISEFKKIAFKITEHNPLIRDYVIQRKEKQGKTNYSLQGTTLSIYLQELEVRILEQIYLYLVEHHYIENKNAVLCADGIMIDTPKYNDLLLTEFSNLIVTRMGFNLKFTVKAMDKIYTLHEINDALIFDLHTQEFTTGMLSDYFRVLFDCFAYYDSKIYFYNGVYWQEDVERMKIYNFIDDKMYRYVLNYYCKTRELIVKNLNTLIQEDEKEKLKKQLEQLEKLHRNIPLLRQNKYRKNLTEDICNKLYDETIVFDKSPNLFAFTNHIFNLALGEVIRPDKYDYISNTCGYEFDPKFDKANIEEFDKILDTIFPNPDNKNYYLCALSTGLTGHQVENLFIATGEGGNGKGVINNIMLRTCGKYGFKLSSLVLLSEIKSGANPEIASLDNKRFALTTEPTDKKKINSSTLKELTGDKVINARFAYSNKCEVHLSLSLFMECNSLPKLDEVNDAIERRIRAVPFISSFKSQEDYDKLEDKTNAYVGNPIFKTDEFENKHKLSLFYLLVPKCKEFIRSGLRLPAAPAQCKAITVDYLTKSDNIYEWVQERYERGFDSDFVYVKDMFEIFRASEYFENLNKSDKRDMTLKSFIEKVRYNIFLKKHFKERDDYIGHVKINKPAISGFKIKNPTNVADFS